MTIEQELKNTITQMVRGKGILAADESTPTIAARFSAIKVASTPENHRAYRDLLLTTPGINQFLWGVILFEETLFQSTLSGQPFPQYLQAHGIVPGIKVDEGTTTLANTSGEKITVGLDTLEDRLQKYQAAGARFAKWRAVITIGEKTPSRLALHANAECLARYAAICQAKGIVPIIEPEVIMEGNHTLERCAHVTEKTHHMVFAALIRHKVKLEYIILKPNMVIAGKNCAIQASSADVARTTIAVLRRTTPAAVPSINFLSGGQRDSDAAENLKIMNTLGEHPWLVSFSYGRALQEACLRTWAGKAENVAAAQKVFYHSAEQNSAACLGKE